MTIITDSERYRKIFRKVDFKKSDSLKAHIPCVEGKGKKGYIPTSILGCSTNPFEVLAKAEEYRKLGEGRQKSARDKWNALSRAEKKPFQATLQKLMDLQDSLIAGDITWESIATPVDADQNLAQAEAARTRRSNRRRRGQQTDRTAAANTPTTAATPVDIEPSPPTEIIAIPSEDSEEESGEEQEQEHERSSRFRLKRGMTEPTDEDEEMAHDEHTRRRSFVGIGSSAAERQAESTILLTKASRTKKRKVGMPATDLWQQSDSTAMGQIYATMKKGVVAAKTMACANAINDDDQNYFVGFFFQQIKETPAGGGRPNPKDLHLKKPKLIAFGNTEKIPELIRATRKALKHHDNPEKESKADVSLFSSPTKFDSFLASKTDCRKGRARKPATFDEVIPVINEELIF